MAFCTVAAIAEALFSYRRRYLCSSEEPEPLAKSEISSEKSRFQVLKWEVCIWQTETERMWKRVYSLLKGTKAMNKEDQGRMCQLKSLEW